MHEETSACRFLGAHASCLTDAMANRFAVDLDALV